MPEAPPASEGGVELAGRGQTELMFSHLSQLHLSPLPPCRGRLFSPELIALQRTRANRVDASEANQRLISLVLRAESLFW
jgi:hypothetical protein